MSLENNLHDLRKKNHLNQYEFAQSIGITRTILSRYENGTIKPSIETLQKIAAVYHVSIDKLLDIPIYNRFDNISDIMRVLIFLQDIGGIDCTITMSDDGINFKFGKDAQYSKQICEFVENYLAHKNDFDLIPDEEIRKMSYNMWFEKQLQKYSGTIRSKEKYQAQQKSWNTFVDSLTHNYGSPLDKEEAE